MVDGTVVDLVVGNKEVVGRRDGMGDGAALGRLVIDCDGMEVGADVGVSEGRIVPVA